MAEITRIERAAIIGQLVAMDNVLHGVLESLQDEPEPETVTCLHPVDQRQYPEGGTMGSRDGFTCGACNAVVDNSTLDPSRLVRPIKE